MQSRDSRVEGAAAWAAYGALEVMLAIYARRLLAAPEFVPPHDGYTLLLLVLYPLAGALLGRLAIPGLAVLFAANAILAMDGRVVAVAIGVAAMVIVLRARAWTAASLLVVPVWAARELADRQSFAVKAAAAAGAILVIGIIAMLRKRHGRPLRPAITLAIFAAAMLGSLFVEMAPPRDLRPDAPPPRTRQPNVVLVLMDTVRADHLSAYGYARDTTPHLKRFARSATLYRRAYAASNMTLASTASLFTGRFGSEHTAHFDDGWPLGRPLPPSALTVAELLSARGYATALITSNNTYLGPKFGLDQGFQHFDARSPALPFGAAPDFTLRRGLASLAEAALPARFRRGRRPAAEITGLARRYVSRAAGKRRPFFLVVNYMDAHVPCIPPPPYDSRFPGRDASQSVGLADRLIATMFREEPVKITAREHAHLLSQYDGGIAYQDAEIARLLDDLRARKAYDDTLIVIVSDHGEAFGEHGVVAHGMTNYEDQVHVPFIVKRPGQTAGSVIDEPVSVLEAWPIMTGTAHAPFPVLTESFPMRGPNLAQKFRRPGRARIEGTLKTIVNVRDPIELYELARDPAESRNLGRTATSMRMSAELTAWQRSLKAQKPLPPRELDAETIRRLRALGYLQ